MRSNWAPAGTGPTVAAPRLAESSGEGMGPSASATPTRQTLGRDWPAAWVRSALPHHSLTPSPRSPSSPIPSNCDAMPVHALLPLLLHAVLILFFRFVWLWNCLAGALASPLRNERQRSLSLSVRSSSLYWSSLFSCLLALELAVPR